MSTRLAIVGLGRLGYEHARNIHTRIAGAELAAICSVRQEELDRVTSEMQPDFVTQSFEELLAWGKFDGLVIATSSGVHAEQICAAAGAGVKNVYTEKPLGMSMEELWRIKSAVDANQGMLFQVGYNHRFDADMVEAKRRLEDGFVGRPVFIRLVSRDKTHVEKFLLAFSPSSGGLVADVMTHDYDTARWLLGAEAKRIFGLGDAYHFEKLKDVPDIDNAVILMEFTDGTMVQIEASRNAAYGYHAPMEIFGTKGAIKVGDTPRRNRSAYLSTEGVVEECADSFFEYWEDTYQAELADFVDCIRTGRAPKVGLEDGFKAVEWAFAAAQAVREKKVVEFRSAF
jgi:myo-inositol 2-dehydrogenase / D-chiro-inositol 1-dehydrogenase